MSKGMEARTKEAPMEKDLSCWVGALGPKKAGLTRHHPAWVQEIMGDIKYFLSRE